jgi:DNA-binding CsgD family transcriptional regulator
MLAKGATDAECARHFKRSEKAIQHARARAGIPANIPPPRPKQQREQHIVRTVEQRRHAAQMDYTPMRRDIRITQKWRAAYPVADLVCAGVPLSEIAARLDITEQEAASRWSDYQALMHPYIVNTSPFTGKHTYAK